MGNKYIIKNATVVSVDKDIGTVPNCDVLIEDSFIQAVGPNLKHTTEHTVIDGTNSIVSPGFIDTHRHTWQSQLRTIAGDYILADYVLSLRHEYGSCYTPQDAYIGNLCGALESINNGTTYLVDHSHIMNSPDHADAAIKGLQDAKVRAVFCYALWRNPPWKGSNVDARREKETPNWRIKDAKRIKDQYFPSNAPEDLLRFGFAPGEPDSTPFDQLCSEIEEARSIGAAVITAHISFGRYDPGNRIVRKLEQKGLLGPDMLLSHANTLQDDELEAVQKRGVGLSSTPDTEFQMGMSHPIAFKAADCGAKASLGVDVCCSSPADIFQQMRLLLQAQRHLEHESAPGTPLKMSRKCSEVLEMATLGGARAVGLEDVIGSITPGKKADILITKCDSPRLVPVHDPIAALVLYANASDIDTVFIDGEIVKWGGKLTAVDWSNVREQLRTSTAAIVEKSKEAPIDELEAARDALVAFYTIK